MTKAKAKTRVTKARLILALLFLAATNGLSGCGRADDDHGTTDLPDLKAPGLKGHPAEETETRRPSPHAAGIPNPGAFTLAVIPDTQEYPPHRPQVFFDEVNWIIEHAEEQRVRFVSHVGDIVDRYDASGEWDVADAALSPLWDTDIPFGLTVGNHDYEPHSGAPGLFQEHFPASRFADKPWYAGSERNNMNSFQLFENGDEKYVIFHIECNATDSVLAWMDARVAEHLDRHLIITTHMYLGPVRKPLDDVEEKTLPRGRMRWTKCHGPAGNSAEAMWNKSFRKYPNLFLVLSGDQSHVQAWHQTSIGDHGNVVHEAMSDYRDGYIRLMRIDRSAGGGKGEIQVVTYSPTLDELETGSKRAPRLEDHQFTFEGL